MQAKTNKKQATKQKTVKNLKKTVESNRQPVKNWRKQ